MGFTDDSTECEEYSEIFHSGVKIAPSKTNQRTGEKRKLVGNCKSVGESCPKEMKDIVKRQEKMGE